MRNQRIIMILAVIVACAGLAAAQDLPSPEQYFGHKMGAEGMIVDFMKSLDYYRLLAERSDRMQFSELGKTTDGNPFTLAIISSPKNMARLDDIRSKRDLMCDPRKTTEEQAMQLAAELPAVVFHTGSIHSTEISTAQVPPELVYMLVSGNSPEILNILENTIILVSPSANPDGQVMLNKWYGQYKGQPWEGNMPWLYQSYVGHDDNRDWIMLHFPEQLLTAKYIFMKWHPIYSHEMHQMGASGARIFVPPYIEPSDPNTPPFVIETMNMIGMAMSHRLTTEKKAGVVKNAIYDLFTPARAFQVYHGAGRILTETAGSNFARAVENRESETRGGAFRSRDYDPNKASWNFPMPWKGKVWAPREMVEYQLSAAMAAMRQAACLHYEFNLGVYRALKYAVDGEDWPYAYIIPAEQRDPGSTARLLRTLQQGGIEIKRSTAPFEAGGESFGSGSYVIVLRQPYGGWAKTLLEIQHYPDLRKSPNEPPVVPYDITGHTLPLLMGVRAVQVAERFEASLESVGQPVRIAGNIADGGNEGFAILPEQNDAYALVDSLLDDGLSVKRLNATARIGSTELPAGSFIVAHRNGLKEKLSSEAKSRSFSAVGLRSPLPSNNSAHALHNPRIGIYESWGGLIDAGWTRLIFQQWELEFKTLRNDDIKAGKLADNYDIIIMPDGIRYDWLMKGGNNWPQQYCGGIEEEGKTALIQFLNQGGTLLAFGRSSMTVVELLNLPLKNELDGLQPTQFFGPGNIVLAELDTASPLNYGMPEKTPVQFVRGEAFSPVATTKPGPEMAARYPNYDPRLSGFLLGPEYLQGKGALAVQPYGEGRVILFGFSPQFRGMTDATYKMVFNAIFWAAED